MKPIDSTPTRSARKGTRTRRTSDDEQQAFKKAIEAVAFQLFVNEGFEAVSIRKIAAAVGCSPMTVYSYHVSKQRLLRTLWQHVFLELDEQCGRAAKKKTTASAKLEAHIRAWLEFWLARPDSFRLVFWNTDTPDASSEPYFADSSDVHAMRSGAVELIAQVRKNSLAKVASSRILDVILAQLVGYLHLSLAAPELGWAHDDALKEAVIHSIQVLVAAKSPP